MMAEKGGPTCTAELLQCHAYTDCTMIVCTPAGCKLSDVCSPMRHVSVCKTVVFPRNKTETTRNEKTATAISRNPTETASIMHTYFQDATPPKDDSGAVSPTAPWSGASKVVCEPKKTAIDSIPLQIGRPRN